VAAPTRLPEHPVEEVEHGFRFVLAQRSFRLIWFSQLASQVADKFLMFSLLILAYSLAGGSSQVAVTLLAYTLPAIFIGPLAGVFADRHDRKMIMVAANFARAGIVVLLPIAALVPFLQHDFWHLLVITFAFSAVGQLFSPAEASAIPTVLPRRALLTANSLVMVTLVLTLVVGGTLAPIVAGVDIYVPYWVSGLLMLAAALCCVLADIPKLAGVRGDERLHPFRQVWVELLEGLRVLRNSNVLLLSFGQLSLAVLVLLMMWTLAPAYVKTVIGVPPNQSYVVLVPAMVGAIISAALLRKATDRWSHGRLLCATLLAMGLSLGALAGGPLAMRNVALLAAHTRIFGAAVAFILGLEFGVLMIPALTYLMEHTSDSIRGRIFALLFMVINGVAAIPILVAAVLADVIGTDWVIGGMGGLLVVGAAAGLRYAPAGAEARSS
jgi:MFS family permease